MKRAVLFAFILSVSSLSLFGNGARCGSFDGFYSGAAIGVATGRASFHMSATNQLTGRLNDTGIFSIDSKNSKYSPWGELFAGWGRQCSAFYWGGRLALNFSRFNPQFHIHASDTTAPGNASVDFSLASRMNTTEFTFDFKPGWAPGFTWIFCPRWMIYGILGGAVNKVRLETITNASEQIGTRVTATGDIKFKKERTRVGFHTGVGFETEFTSCLKLQLAYLFTYYGKMHLSRLAATTISGETIIDTIDFKASATKQVASVGLVFYY